MRHPFILSAAFLLAACVGNVRETEFASFDLGSAAIVWKPAEIRVSRVDVEVPSWLTTTAIHYRLVYVDAQRRHGYVESRWVAPPAELMERALNRQPTVGEGGCRVVIDVDELAQFFDSPASSRVLFDARVRLVSPAGGATVARKSFSVVSPAASTDARGGVAATSSVVQGMAGEIGAWLTQVARDTPAVAERCKAG